MICELGGNKGIGFDPAYVPARNQSAQKEDVTFIEDFYSEKYSQYHGDLVACKMTLEHIHQPADFIGTVRRSIGERHETVVFFQVPDTRRVLRDSGVLGPVLRALLLLQPDVAGPPVPIPRLRRNGRLDRL